MGTNLSKSDGELDAAMDAVFRRARIDGEGGVAWDERADATLRAATDAGPPSSGTLDALLEAPSLDGEPGEPSAPSRSPNSRTAGTPQMSDESIPKPPSSRRPSLKEMAESVKNRPATPVPGSVRPSSPEGSPASAPGSQRHSLKDTLVALDGQLPPPPSGNDASVSARPPTPMPHAVGPRSVGPVSAGPASSPPAGAPASVPAAVAPIAPVSNPAAIPSTKPSPGVAKTPAKEGGGNGMLIGLVVVGLAAAAAFGLWMKSGSQPAPVPSTVAAVETGAPATEPRGDKPEAKTPEAAPKKEDGVLDLSQLDDAKSAAPLGGPLPGGPLPSPSAAPAASAPAAVASGGPAKPAGPGEDLDDAIRNRAGGPNGSGDDAEPAAAEGSKKNLPDVPPTGAVTSAVNAVKGSAKGCVAGADEPSTATITFGSSGAVQSVSVGGWAQGKSAAGCIQSALKAAKVPAFARPSYSTSVTIRP